MHITGFQTLMQEYDQSDINRVLQNTTKEHVLRVLARQNLTPYDYLALLSPAAATLLEPMARRARQLTIQHFGKTILLFTPLYLSNYCTNQCVYCGFNTCNNIKRTQLDTEAIKKEGAAIAATGLKHLLILTGEAPKRAPVSYIAQAATLLGQWFSSISIEVYAMDTEQYTELVQAGVDGLTIYQETYNKALYQTLHPKGPKSKYFYRLDAPERGCMAGMRTVNIGALLGLDLWQHDAFYTGLHAHYLQKKYPATDISISLPRMRPHTGDFTPRSILSDQGLVQVMLAQRIFLPQCGITLSTREPANLRDNLIPLGVTKMSAGVSTAVGGHTSSEEEANQFDISDERSVEKMCLVIKEKNYQPVFKDWEPLTG